MSKKVFLECDSRTGDRIRLVFDGNGLDFDFFDGPNYKDCVLVSKRTKQLDDFIDLLLEAQRTLPAPPMKQITIEVPEGAEVRVNGEVVEI